MSQVLDPTHADRMNMVAVRDGGDLYEFLRIRRSSHGDVYTAIANKGGKWNPHGSWHADGWYHQKGHDHPSNGHRRRKPDANFRGTENHSTICIEPEYARKVGRTCDPSKFSEVLEIPVEKLRPLPSPTNISVDLSEPGGQPIVAGPSSVILAYWELRDAVPWIIVTLFYTV